MVSGARKPLIGRATVDARIRSLMRDPRYWRERDRGLQDPMLRQWERAYPGTSLHAGFARPDPIPAIEPDAVEAWPPEATPLPAPHRDGPLHPRPAVINPEFVWNAETGRWERDPAHRPGRGSPSAPAPQPLTTAGANAAGAADAPGPHGGLGHNSGRTREAALDALRERAADGAMSASEFLKQAERIRLAFPDENAPDGVQVAQASGASGAESGGAEAAPVYGYGVRADPGGGGRNPDLESRFPWRLHDVDAGGPSAADPKTGAQIGWPEPGVVQGEGLVLIDPRTGDSVLDPDGKPYGVSPEAQRRLRARIDGLLETPVDRMTPAQRAALHEAVTAQRLLFDGPPEPSVGGEAKSDDAPAIAPEFVDEPAREEESPTGGRDVEQPSDWDRVLDALVDRLNDLWEEPEPPSEDPFNGPEDPPPPLVPNPGGQGGRKQRPAPTPTPSPGPAWTRKAVIRRLLRALSLEEDRDPHPNLDAGKHGARKKR